VRYLCALTDFHLCFKAIIAHHDHVVVSKNIDLVDIVPKNIGIVSITEFPVYRPSLKMITVILAWRAKNGRDQNRARFCTPKVGVAKIAARFARLLPYLITNPAAAYAMRKPL